MTQAPVGREVGRAVLDHGTPFFLSYAHTDSNSGSSGGVPSSGQMAERFYYDLREEVQTLVSLLPGSEMGFMDIVGLRGGMHWRPELMLALGSCQVLVALLSVPYLDREWCGKEWHAFSLRTVERLPGATASPYQGCIIPVWWAPVPFPLPALIREEMIFAPPRRPEPDLPEQYKQNGVFGLMTTGQENSYRIIVWELAKLIQRIYYSQQAMTRKFDPGELRNVFRGGEP